MNRDKFIRAVKCAIKNTVVMNFIATLILGPLCLWLGCPILPEDIPSLPQLVIEFCVFIVAQEVAFYYSHRYVLC